MNHATNPVFRANVISRLYAESALRLLGGKTPEAYYQGYDTWKDKTKTLTVQYRHHYALSFFEMPKLWVDVVLIENSNSHWGYSLFGDRDVRVAVPMIPYVSNDIPISMFLADTLNEQSFGLHHYDPNNNWTTPLAYKLNIRTL